MTKLINIAVWKNERSFFKKIFLFLLSAMFGLNAFTQEIKIKVNTNPYALVAGGSKGIGYAIAEALAKRKYNLVLIARHADSLNAAKKKLEAAYSIHVELLQLDLEKETSADSIANWC